MEIRALSEADIPAFWSVRLRALALTPESFGTSYDDERHATLSDVVTRFGREWTAHGGFVLGAFEGPNLVGTIGLRRRLGTKRRHIAEFWAVWVAPEHRRRGVGRALTLAAIERARSAPDLEQIELSVGLHNAAARRLYLGLGFTSYGVAPRALKIGTRYLEEELMALDLDHRQRGQAALDLEGGKA